MTIFITHTHTLLTDVNEKKFSILCTITSTKEAFVYIKSHFAIVHH